ncbi:MAG: LytTR family transcriptional regulator [Bacteroidetes bacterium]|nr:LytTR family transcriptional regulator [Bacteroidota bacterium]
MTSTDKPAGYHDLSFRLIISLIAAHIIVSFGAKESFFQLLISWYYYRSLILSFIIAFLLISEVYLATVKLDRYFDWSAAPVKRIGTQLLFGLGMPSITAFLLAAVYFGMFGYNILVNTYYLRFDFPVIVIMLLLLNIYYLAFYFYRKWQYAESRLRPVAAGNPTAQNGRNKEVILVQEGSRSIPILIEDVCYFYHDGRYNFARTNDREDYIIDQTMDEIQQQLPEKQFFRISRQAIVNFASCKHFRQGEFGKLELSVEPEAKEPFFVSQKRVKQFRDWIAR